MRLFQVAAGKQRSPQGEGCRWLLMPGGGRREVRGRGACGWNGCYRLGKVRLLVRNESGHRIWGKSRQFEATTRVGVVLLGRLERDWIAIGWRLESSST